MTARQLRRAQEHTARKLARKANSAVEQNQTPATRSVYPQPQTVPVPPEISPARLEANRANAQLSTGPRTEEGKAISSRNNFRHGFTGVFCILPDEDDAAFRKLLAGLEAEHDPATPTESLLVGDMARHYWLTQRAIRLQEECFAAGSLDDSKIEKKLALYIRYQTTNQRAFHRCLGDLLKLRRARQSEQRGFESQQRRKASDEARLLEQKQAAEHQELLILGAKIRCQDELMFRELRESRPDIFAAGASASPETSKPSKAAQARQS